MANHRQPPHKRPQIKTGDYATGNSNTPGFIFINNENQGTNDVVMTSKKALASYNAVASRDRYSGYESNISVRNQFTRGDYEYFRGNETVPEKPADIIRACRRAYKRVGLIRNVIDLMSDFGSQGVQLNHPNPRIQKFYRGWFKKVGGYRISERFLNLFYREAVVIIKRATGRINSKHEKYIRSIGEKLQPEVQPDEVPETARRNIPLRYNFLNPLTLEVLGEEVAPFVGKMYYGLKISHKLRNAISYPKNEAEAKLISLLPTDLKNKIAKGERLIPLEAEKLCTAYYKRDDWQAWPEPMIYAILDDLILLEKMKLADLSALDGAISQVRLWKLGDLEKEIFPTDAGVQKLIDILLSNPGGGAFDLVWGPELTVEEYKTNVHQFLGKQKYEPVYDSIYAGLGVPPTLTGAATSSGFTNNYISLKTLVQRLEYGRAALREFWEQEIELVRQAMGFRIGAKVSFNRMVLSDETAEKALLFQLVDRDMISVDRVAEIFGEDAEFERLKTQREERMRKANQMRPKAGPYHTAEKSYELAKVALGRGYVAPDGLEGEIDDAFLDVESPFEMQLKAQEKVASMRGPAATGKKPKGTSGQGRPKNSKDGSKRKTKTVKPAGASLAALCTATTWARDVQKTIASFIQPVYLQMQGKRNMREATAADHKACEDIKFRVLCNLDPFAFVNEEVITACVKECPALPTGAEQLCNQISARFVEEEGRSPNLEEMRTIHASVYALISNAEEFLDG